MGNLCGTPAVRVPSDDSVADIGECICSIHPRQDAVKVESEEPPYVKDPFLSALADAAAELKANSSKSFKDLYDTREILGQGAFAKVSKCVHRETGNAFAVKSVSKTDADPERQLQGILKEVAIMRTLQDHPNVIALHDVFEDEWSYFLVMELCSGGELFDQIISKGHFSEKDAAGRMRCLLDFICFAHSKNIVHRDLKPENALLTDSTADATIKIIDFGTSEFCQDGQKLSEKFGTPYYVAPEVLRKNYGKAIDVWSAGVIMYILLCGYPPFGGKTDSVILEHVHAGLFDFNGPEWSVVTDTAKSMICAMLKKDTIRRATAQELLQHPWFQVADAAPAAALGTHMVKRLCAFASMGKMKRLALVVLARTLTDTDVRRLRELFSAMDANNDGMIDCRDLHHALKKVGAAIDPSEMADVFFANNLTGTGQIDYGEFIAAMLDSNRVASRKEVVRRSFDQLDANKDGFITVGDIVKLMPRGFSLEAAQAILEEADEDGDGIITYAEVVKDVSQLNAGNEAVGVAFR